MIKKIDIRQLRVGMYIDDLDANWLDHNFVTQRFAVKDHKTLQKLIKSGLKHLYIDTDKGKDVEEAPTIEVVQERVEEEVRHVAPSEKPLENRVSVEEELSAARGIYKEASGIMQNLMEGMRFGKEIEVNSVREISDQMVESAFRNKDALISLSRIKDKDHYTYMHSVSVSGLMITFGRTMGFDKQRIRDIAIGGLLHDIGKMETPDKILNKPGKLTDHEFDIMRSHVVYSRELLQDQTGITQDALDVAAQHHERVDGSGYPLGLKGDEISEVGQMSTIVDVYDALTSVRVYKNAWEPNLVLKKLMEWSSSHFNPTLVHMFIRCLGVYPIGAMVELESGLIGIVIEQNEVNLLKPKVKIVYSAKHHHYVPAHEVDLEKSDDFIKTAIDPKKYQINPTTFYY
ncbi:MAG: HD-GYP domain-containing protein [Gammaproteobacteria bacterium]|nr:HD-GYP domain-containing protein [Gammaproteobacteria bacterium]